MIYEYKMFIVNKKHPFSISKQNYYYKLHTVIRFYFKQTESVYPNIYLTKITNMSMNVVKKPHSL